VIYSDIAIEETNAHKNSEGKLNQGDCRFSFLDKCKSKQD